MAEISDRLTVGIIGCGAIAHEHLKFLSTAPMARLAAVCDASRVTAQFVQKRYRAESYFVDYREMLTAAHPDVVHVLTPPHTHKSLVAACLERGAHVICEKPMTATAAETIGLLDQAKRHGKTLVETRNLLFNDGVLAIDTLKAEGRLGSVREVELLLALDLVNSAFGDLNLEGPAVDLPAGAIQDLLPHLAYLLLHFLNHQGPVDAVHGLLVNSSGNRRLGYDQLDALVQIGPCRGRIRMASDLKPDMFRLAVRGTAGAVETDLYNPFFRVEGGANVGKRAPLEQVISGLRLAGAGFTNFKNKVLQHSPYHGVPRMLRAIYEALRTGGSPPIHDYEIVATALLVDRLVQLRDAR